MGEMGPMTEELNAYRSALRNIISMSNSEMRGGDGAREVAKEILLRWVKLDGPRYVVTVTTVNFPGDTPHYFVRDTLLGIDVGYTSSMKAQADYWADNLNKGLQGNPNDLGNPRVVAERIRKLHSALAGLVGSSDLDELRRMHKEISHLPIKLAGDREALLTAIDALMDNPLTLGDSHDQTA